MAMRLLMMAVVALAATLPRAAQSSDSQSSAFKTQYDIVKGYVTKAAEKAPADLYSFKPTPEVRSFGAVLAHIADANYGLCSMATGGKSPMERGAVEKSGNTVKTELQKALADSYKFCDDAFATLTAANEGEKVNLFGMEQTRLSTLAFVTAHNFEHYGNLVTYLRLKNIVPPSSEPRKPAESPKSK